MKILVFKWRCRRSLFLCLSKHSSCVSLSKVLYCTPTWVFDRFSTARCCLSRHQLDSWSLCNNCTHNGAMESKHYLHFVKNIGVGVFYKRGYRSLSCHLSSCCWHSIPEQRTLWRHENCTHAFRSPFLRQPRRTSHNQINLFLSTGRTIWFYGRCVTVLCKRISPTLTVDEM